MIKSYDKNQFVSLVKAGGIINTTLQSLPEDIAMLYDPQFKQLLALIEHVSHLAVLTIADEPSTVPEPSYYGY